MDFTSTLSPHDNMPPLWPRAPRWPHDSSLKSRLFEKTFGKTGLPRATFDMVVSSYLQQRDQDCRYRHCQHLVDNVNTTEVKTMAEWAAMLLTKSGWVADGFAGGGDKVTARSFMGKWARSGGMKLAPSFKLPNSEQFSKCDECGKACTSECQCGELFCSRRCMAKQWAAHRKICETVHDNSEVAILLTQVEMHESLTSEEKWVALGDKTSAAHAAKYNKKEAEKEAFAKASGLRNESVESDASTRNFARMRLNERDGVLPHAPSIVTLRHQEVDGSFLDLRLRSPIFSEATRSWQKVWIYENRHTMASETLAECAAAGVDCSSPEACVSALLDVLIKDDTAAQIRIDPQSRSIAMPRMIAALQCAAKNVKHEPKLGTDALVCLSFFSACVDQSLGDGLASINRVLDSTILRRNLTCEASAFMIRSLVRITRNDPVGSLEDCLEATRLALAKGDEGLAWSFGESKGKAFRCNGKLVEALSAFESVADATDSALRVSAAGGVSLLGGRELDPYRYAKAIEAEYNAAQLLLEGGTSDGSSLGTWGCLPLSVGSKKEMIRRGRDRYSSAAEKEAKLPDDALQAMNSNSKLMCQLMLSKLPLTTKTQAAINAGSAASGRSSFLECSGCGTTEHKGLKLCSACKSAAYCNSGCQRKHWKSGHREECKKK